MYLTVDFGQKFDETEQYRI